MLVPIVRYAHLIGKNTAEFTTKDMTEFTSWWMRQPEGQTIMEGTVAQKKQYDEDVKAMEQWRQSEKERKMSKKTSVQKFQDAQTSRLPAELTEEPVPNGVDHMEIICDMGLTAHDVKALQWVLHTMFSEFEMEGHMFESSLKGLKEGLEGV